MTLTTEMQADVCLFKKKRLSFTLPEGLYRSWCPLSLIGYCILYEKSKKAFKKSKKEFQQNIGMWKWYRHLSIDISFSYLLYVKWERILLHIPYIISNFDITSFPLPFSESERSCFRGT
jgi:hypothetical protein